MRRVATAGGGEENKLSTTTQFEGGIDRSGVGGVGTGYRGQFCPRRARAIAAAESVQWHAAAAASAGEK